MRRRFGMVLAVVTAVTVGCGGSQSPNRPSEISPAVSVASPTTPERATTLVTWSCLAATGSDALGFRPAGGGCSEIDLRPASRFQPLTLAPGTPTNLGFSVSGNTVTFSWVRPSSGDAPASYIVEAGSIPQSTNLANFDTQNNSTSLTVTQVPTGTYFVRVRALNAAGVSGPSNEVVINVVLNGPAPCAGAPNVPSGLAASLSGEFVTLTWNASVGATSYVIQAGSALGASNLANFDTGNPGTIFIANAPAGTYFVRLAARNACGTSAVSNDVSFTTVSAAATFVIVNSPNPVPWNGTPISNSTCAGVANTWFYTITLNKTGGGQVTLTSVTNIVDGFQQTDININFLGFGPGTGTFTSTRAFCFNQPTQHTIQTTFRGTDTSGNPVSFTAPVAVLLAR